MGIKILENHEAKEELESFESSSIELPKTKLEEGKESEASRLSLINHQLKPLTILCIPQAIYFVFVSKNTN
jgi:hypothetical protein